MRQFLATAILGLSVTIAIAQPTSRPASPQAEGIGVAIASQRIAAAVKADPVDSPGQVVVVYFTPRDQKPPANHVERIRRIAEETAGFYGREMVRHGFMNRSMNVRRNNRDQIEVIDVVGKDTDYDKPDGNRIREETIPVLREQGIDPDTSVLLLFCNLMDYDPIESKISHHSPYYGGGSHLSGTAWQCDSEILDPKRFQDTTPILDGEYGRITIGRHNSIFIGGVIHELGHALSLPHCRQREDESQRGTALMGSGNRTYAQELRGEGRGTFLTQAHAFRLAAHPVFNKQVPGSIHQQAEWDAETIAVEVGQNNTILIQGKVSSNIPIHAMVAYFDPDGGGDYDATTATAVPDDDGVFAMRSGQVKPGVSAELRLVACHVNGSTTSRAMRFRVDKTGQPDLSVVRLELELAPMIEALRASDYKAARERLDELAGGDNDLKAIGQRVLDRFADSAAPATIDPSNLPADVKSIALSRLKPVVASVGWIRPTFDGVPEGEKLLSIGGDYFASGIYAHAPAKHEYKLGGAWKRLGGRCGIQGSHFGRVDFEIVGDGKLLWSTRGVTAGDGHQYDVDVQGVEYLTLIVTEGGNGRAGDWGVWIEPRLSR